MQTRLDNRALWVAAWWLLCPLSAAAEEAKRPQSDVAVARQLFDWGLEHFRSGEFEAAASDFEAALRMKPHPSVLFNLGRAYAAAGRPIHAVNTLEQYLAQDDPNLNPQRRAQVTDLIAAQRRLFGTIRITATTPGIAIQLDGVAVGETPQSSAIPAPVGKHTIRGTRNGFVPTEVTIELDASPEQEVEVNLEPQPQMPEATARPEPIPKPKPTTAVVSIPPPKAPSSPRRIGVAALGVGVAALGVGSYFAVRAQDSWAERQQHCGGGSCDARAVEAWRDAKRYAFATDVSMALGLVSAGAGIYLLIANSFAQSSTTGTRLSVGATSSGAVIQLGGAL
ncbi:MAG TPA: PEGA domain-containing protein [Polyangiaceae bacterium]|nr:PEGA domain-containing protein [Polyangiaceae bacterium]